jgi:hypothetical protein
VRQRKFESLEAAKEYLVERGELKFWGRIGNQAEICLYTYKHQGREYTLYIYMDGLVQIRE